MLRYAVLASRADSSVYQRLAADIETICPGIAMTSTWMDTPDTTSGCELAECRAKEHRRDAGALLAALRKPPQALPLALAAEVEAVTYGWAALLLAGTTS